MHDPFVFYLANSCGRIPDVGTLMYLRLPDRDLPYILYI